MPPSSSPGIITPGKSVGGLLILHPLTVSSTLSVVSLEMQTHFRNCLAWIGDNMGIGQATLLAKVSEFLMVRQSLQCTRLLRSI
jgi:hypothetical protein